MEDAAFIFYLFQAFSALQNMAPAGDRNFSPLLQRDTRLVFQCDQPEF